MTVALFILLFGMIVAIIMFVVGVASDIEPLAIAAVVVAILTVVSMVLAIAVSSNQHVDNFRHRCEKLGGHVNGNGDLCLKPGSEIQVP